MNREREHGIKDRHVCWMHRILLHHGICSPETELRKDIICKSAAKLFCCISSAWTDRMGHSRIALEMVFGYTIVEKRTECSLSNRTQQAMYQKLQASERGRERERAIERFNVLEPIYFNNNFPIYHNSDLYSLAPQKWFNFNRNI